MAVLSIASTFAQANGMLWHRNDEYLLAGAAGNADRRDLQTRHSAGGVCQPIARARAAAIGAATLIRLRPVRMTSAALVLAMMPLLIAAGASESARCAMGLVIAGGMTATNLLTFVAPRSWPWGRPLQRVRAAAVSRIVGLFFGGGRQLHGSLLAAHVAHRYPCERRTKES